MTWAQPVALDPLWLAQLDAAELARQAAMRRPANRVGFCVAHALRRLMLVAASGLVPEAITFNQAPSGAPGILLDGQPTDWAASLAHTRQGVAVAVGQLAALGVDIEVDDRPPVSAEMLHHGLGAEDAEAVLALPVAQRTAEFLRLWVIKEAVSKAERQGRALGFGRIHFIPPDQARVAGLSGGAERHWRVWCHRPGPQHSVAVAAPQAAPPPVFRDLTLAQFNDWCAGRSAMY